MKIKLMSLAAAFFLLLSCGPTRYDTTTSNAALTVPSGITTSFQTQYPTAANVTWNSFDPATVPIDWEMTGWTTLDKGDYVARFDVGSDQYYAWYDSEGNWIGSTFAVRNFNDLPASVSNLIMTKYSGYKIESVQNEMWKDHTAYEIKLKNGEQKTKLLVDLDGNILKSKEKY